MPQRPEEKPLPWFAKDELASPLRSYRPEFRCLVHDLRMWSWYHRGISTGDLVRLSLSFGFTKNQIGKYMLDLKHFFKEREGRVYYEPDEFYREAPEKGGTK